MLCSQKRNVLGNYVHFTHTRLAVPFYDQISIFLFDKMRFTKKMQKSISTYSKFVRNVKSKYTIPYEAKELRLEYAFVLLSSKYSEENKLTKNLYNNFTHPL